MELLWDISSWRRYAEEHRSLGHRVGLVPTMGALHSGHEALFHAAQVQNDAVIATIFVNPRQFNDEADLAAYPRTPDADRALAQASGVDCLVEPSLAEMWPAYPGPIATTVSVGGLGELFEGVDRPGHFDGVASVVAKLFAITGPCRAYFGEKDYQQLAVIRQMVRDLGFDVEVVGCPIVREEGGLAYSSRNVRLSEEGHARALALSRALARVQAAPDCASAQRKVLRTTLEDAGVTIAYAEVVDPSTLMASGDSESGERRVLIAGIVDGVRLLDNGPVTLSARRTDALSH